MLGADRQFSRFISAQLVVAMLAGGAFFIYDKPFESSRTPSGESTDMFEARLWEDPLNTIYNIQAIREQQLIADDSSGIENFLTKANINKNGFIENVKNAVDSTRSNNVNIIGVMMPEGQHSLTIELRRRIRYSIISALNQSKIPVQSEQLSLLRINNDATVDGMLDTETSTQSRMDLVSYEIFEQYYQLNDPSSPQTPKTTIIIWIPEKLLSNKTISTYQTFLDYLNIVESKPGVPIEENHFVASNAILIGPTNSNDLVDIYKEYSNTKENYPEYNNLKSETERNIESLESVENILLDITEITDGYLDYGLAESKRLPLEDCLLELNEIEESSVSGCLQSLNLKDSDTKWFNEVANKWSKKKGRLETIRNTISRFPAITDNNDTEKVLDLIEEIEWYLYDDISILEIEVLLNCLTEPDRLQEVSFVESCLKKINISQYDSSALYIAEDWVAEQFNAEDAEEIEGNISSLQTQKTLFPREKIVVLSPRATISNAILQNELSTGLSAKFSTTTIPGLYRTLDSDEKLLMKIRTELFSRGLKIDSKIALLYEGDGKYGRALQQILDCRSKHYSTVVSESKNINTEEEKACFSEVDSFAYLRGLDGIRPEDTKNQTSNQNTQTSVTSLLESPESLERSFGRHQFDYLRRLSNQISLNNYDAIGVVGTDVYDKLLVLQALKEKNNGAVFFTTDLDATELHASEFAWTQNLLVASALPLALDKDGGPQGNSCEYLQSSEKKPKGPNESNKSDEPDDNSLSISTPPFRDSYQTSYFQATCLALYISEQNVSPTAAQINTKINNKLLNKAAIYEIGRTKPILLSGSQALADTKIPLSRYFNNPLGWFLLQSPSFALFALSSLTWNRERTRKSDKVNPLTDQSIITYISSVPGALATSALICMTAILSMISFLVFESITDAGEPLYILEGVSHWPTTIIRIQVLVFSLTFGLYSFARWKKSNTEMEELISSNKPDDDSEKSYYTPRTLAGWLHQITKQNYDKKTQKDITEIWDIYRSLSSNKKRFRRVIPKAIIWSVCVYIAYYYFTPHPALIRKSFWVADFFFSDWFVLLVTVISLLMVSLANDVTNLGRIFVKALSDYSIIWRQPKRHLLPFTFGGYQEICKPLFVLEIIARRTRDITPLVIFPFGTLLLLVFSRSLLFEGWSWSTELVCVYLLIAGTSLYYALLLQKEASFAKQQAINLLHELRTDKKYWNQDQYNHEHFNTCIETALDYVENLNKGAFVPWFRHPISQALFLPFMGTGGLLLLQSF